MAAATNREPGVGCHNSLRFFTIDEPGPASTESQSAE
jgi:hypothetical protein